jgi:hypothetical protein
MNQQEQAIHSSSRANRSAKRLLLDKRFQLKYTAMIVSVAALLSLVLGGFLFTKVRENSRMLDLEALGDSGFATQLESTDSELAWMIGLSLLCFMLVITLLSILITHRLAGPIYVMKRHLGTLAGGQIPQIRGLRKGDEFVQCHEVLVDAVSALEKQVIEDVDILSRTVQALSAVKEPQIIGIRAELEALLEHKKTLLKPPA